MFWILQIKLLLTQVTQASVLCLSVEKASPSGSHPGKVRISGTVCSCQPSSGCWADAFDALTWLTGFSEWWCGSVGCPVLYYKAPEDQRHSSQDDCGEISVYPLTTELSILFPMSAGPYWNNRNLLYLLLTGPAPQIGILKYWSTQRCQMQISQQASWCGRLTDSEGASASSIINLFLNQCFCGWVD